MRFLLRLLQRTVLKPKYSLRFQLWISFGSTAALAIVIVCVSAAILSIQAGKVVQATAESALQDQVVRTIQSSTALLADTVAKNLDNLLMSVSILATVTQDRMDEPFYDTPNTTTTTTGKQQYPLMDIEAPLDWELQANVDDTNFEEHIQSQRYSWYPFDMNLSTAHAKFRSQVYGYTGVIDNTSSSVIETQALRRKVSSLQYVLKPLYETHGSIKLAGVYLKNQGYGASLVFPSYANFHVGQEPTGFYKSIGCDWMRNINNKTNRPFAEEEEIARCHPKDEKVRTDQYNPLERGWCRDQALEQGRHHFLGPYKDAFQSDLWLLTFGKAVFNRTTGEFIACTLADVSISQINQILADIVNVTSQRANDLVEDIALVRWDDGTVITSTEWDGTNATETIGVGELDIVSPQQFEELKALVKEDDIRKAYDDFILKGQKGIQKIVAAYPIPLPPSQPDPDYLPRAMLLVSVSEEVFNVIDAMNNQVRTDVRRLIGITAAAELFGLCVVMGIAWMVARVLTHPLEWMGRTSQQLVQSTVYGKEADNEHYQETEPLVTCTPKTEIMSLVQEFQGMIRGFSGDGPAQVARPSMYEIRNTMGWYRELELLNDTNYPEQSPANTGRRRHSTRREEAAMDEADDQPRPLDTQMRRASLRSAMLLDLETEDTESCSSEDKANSNRFGNPFEESVRYVAKEMEYNCPDRLHLGNNVADDYGDRKVLLHVALEDSRRQVGRSPLFWWIVFLLVIPLLTTIGVICAFVYNNITEAFPELVEGTQESSKLIEIQDVIVSAEAGASFAREALVEPVGEIHLYQRFAEWLLFGAIERSDMLTETLETTEECKGFPNGTCPFYANEALTPCPCEWEDSHGLSCKPVSGGIDSRHLQRRFFAGQRQDADHATGQRSAVSSDFVETSRGATQWWDNTSIVPGASKGTLSSGYNTTYDRLRTLSALAVVEFAIYNYEGFTRRTKSLGSFLGFEADGMLTGYAGCDYSWAELSAFQSTDSNGAARIREDLCPLGKFGYDSRCRGWYASGKAANTTHMTPPYQFATSGTIAVSVTAPLVDPRTNQHIGQALIDFIPQSIVDRTERNRTGIRAPLVLTANVDGFGGDTVAAPGYSLGSAAPPSDEVVLPYDEWNSTNRIHFREKVVAEMKAGRAGNATFKRTSEDGIEESFFVAFAPVVIQTMKPLNSSIFARGVNFSTSLVYSWGVVVRSEDLDVTFRGLEDEIESELQTMSLIFIAIVATTAILVTVTTALIAISITIPVIILHQIVKGVNERTIQDEIPPMEGGSREVNQVYNSFSRLFKIMRFSNSAFFSGNLMWAHKFLSDAYHLFERVGDDKALAVAANNLGNTLLSIFRDKASKGRCHQINGVCVRCTAQECYDKAVELGVEEYELSLTADIDNSVRAEYAQQLSNRYFNRGVFYLLMESDPCAPEDAYERGCEDLERSKGLDRDVRDFWIQTRQVRKNSSLYFERLIRRGCGIIQFPRRGEGDPYDPVDVLHEADSLLASVGRDLQSPLMQGVARAGRLQELEEIAIRCQLHDGNHDEAARFAARMLIEDEYILESAFEAAATAIVQSIRDESAPVRWRPGIVELARAQLRMMSKACRSPVSIPIGKNVILCLDRGINNSRGHLEAVRSNLLSLYNEECYEHDYVSVVVFDNEVDKELSFPLIRKRKLDPVDIAGLTDTSQEGQSSNLLKGLQQALYYVQQPSSDESRRNDSWIVMASDTRTWEKSGLIKQKLRDLNKECMADVNLTFVGINMTSQMTEICKSVCHARDSVYIDGGNETHTLDTAFQDVSVKLVGRTSVRGITVEKF